MKKFFYLSGLQRSGSTLLGSLLSQNPDVYVSPTSPMLDFLCVSEEVLNNLETQYTYDARAVGSSIHRNTFDNFYNHIERPIIIDKHRGWVRNIDTIKMFRGGSPKVISTYRPIAEVITSFIKLTSNDPNNVVDLSLREKNLDINNYNRAKFIWEEWTYEIYDSLRYGLKNNRESIHVIHYKNLVNDPLNELYDIYDFLNLNRYDGHYFEDIQNSLSEQKDEVWGFKGLHDIRTSVNNESWNPIETIGEDLCQYFSVYDELLNI